MYCTSSSLGHNLRKANTDLDRFAQEARHRNSHGGRRIVGREEDVGAQERTLHVYMHDLHEVPLPMVKAKLIIQPVRRWTKNDNESRDVRMFLRDCYTCAAASGQDTWAVLATSVDADVHACYEALDERLVSEGMTRDEAGLQAFLMVTGRDLRDPCVNVEQTLALDRGEIKQERNESMVVYASRFRSAYIKSGSALEETLACDRFVSGIWNHGLRAECIGPIIGGRWYYLEDVVISVAKAEVHAAGTKNASNMQSKSAVAAVKHGGAQGSPHFKKRPFSQSKPQFQLDGSRDAARPSMGAWIHPRRMTGCVTTARSQGISVGIAKHQRAMVLEAVA